MSSTEDQASRTTHQQPTAESSRRNLCAAARGVCPHRLAPGSHTSAHPESAPAAHQTCTLRPTTSVLTAAMSVYALGAGITAAAGTRLALQLILITVFGLHPFQALPVVRDWQSCCSSSLPHQKCLSIGQFACLLPTLVVVAVSQAPSPESNPDSPLPVTATVVHCTTVKADRSEVRVIKQCCVAQGHQTLCQRIRPRRDQPESALHTLPFSQALVFSAAGCNPPPSGEPWKAQANVHMAELCDRVLATRFWRMSKRAPGRSGAIHTLSWR